jgi:hypothetical protein
MQKFFAILLIGFVVNSIVATDEGLEPPDEEKLLKE